MRKPKPGVLRVCWDRPERGEPPDIVYDFGDGCSRRDARLLHAAFSAKVIDGKDLYRELQERGYDLTTLRFTISKTTLSG